MVDDSNSDAMERLNMMTESLRRSEERALAGQLALELMHEIKNPLEALGHLTYLTRAEAEDTDKVRKYMELAEEQMATVTQIIGQTLGFARVAHVARTIAVEELVEAGLRIHQRKIDQRKIHLVKKLARGVTAEVHTGEILQVLSNLIVNSLDALQDEGTICLRVRKSGDRVHLLVADNGHGIAAEHTKKIFEPFFTTKGEQGTGLGLALSKKIIERHKGTIVMRSSVAKGRSGTVTKISLPA